MGPDAGRICIALRLQAVAQRVADMDRTSFADAVCDAVDAAGRLGYLGCLHAIVRLAAAREETPDADGMTCGDLGCLAGLRRQARATIGMHALSVLRGVHGRPGRERPRDGRGRPCRLVSS